MAHLPIVIIIAYILDLIFGDPRWFPHPVKGIGWMVEKAEPLFRKGRFAYRNEKIAGAIFAFTIIVLTWGLTFIVIHYCFSLNLICFWLPDGCGQAGKFLELAVSSFLIYTSLSIKSLRQESMQVYLALKRMDINSARKSLSNIVGRNTENLSERDIIRATVETIAENTVDGIMSPLFYAFIGGAPLALSYKAVNTLDSMVGYKNEKYKNFGWAGAKIDDWTNFIPARLSILLLPLASFISGKSGVNSMGTILRDRKKSPSPNSGIPEAGIAGALGIQLGGLNFYNSVPVEKPFIGNEKNPIGIEHIRESIKICYICSLLSLIAGLFLTWLVQKSLLLLS